MGAGYFSRFHYEAWERIDEVQLVASVNRDLVKAQATGLPAFGDLQHALDETKPDLLDIITPPSTHLDYIQRAVKSGIKAIVCQKPFCQSLDEARQVVELSASASVPIVVHENFRFQPWYRVMKTAMDAGKIGDIHQVTFRLRTGDGQGPHAYMDRQPYFQQMPRFLVHETAVHWIDTFRFLLGEPTEVYADLRRMNPAIAGEDAGYLVLSFGGGRRALFDANRHLDHDADDLRRTLGECAIEGSTGTLKLTGDGAVSLRAFGGRVSETLLQPRRWQGFAGDCVFALQDHVVSGLLYGTPLENLAGEYLPNLVIEAAAYQSANEGRKIGV